MERGINITPCSFAFSYFNGIEYPRLRRARKTKRCPRQLHINAIHIYSRKRTVIGRRELSKLWFITIARYVIGSDQPTENVDL